ncbi:MAG: putative rRNA maturation factor [Candidatus Woesebacteria bacterium GW2011_GWA1_33_30]|uniref:Putative rRNA maturation factor n=1 Tax=Candidatus Woesebacteria bacterium GW2011_GWA2_33_28 TaxID=1618561 RepID=A0A0F9ZUP3_9BACT|nr:MAG: putative rRNA maturation factor [Candidatus Woesebacteria bacterium GW2011_GWA2_33_28]KKP48792.1 MAG: putative rRNA maturation factor [Candidatus Woesebacteria bacterium GW2011_GWA1_33_30]KKP50065.1 MAG: putative rRNA maturation factor [Microgenomates group bacterium GW2011_GWC1_33_32]KKP51836.1 MAG: putative rRNA maturation factor [Candidatus Woesebacteria bacterium GW2011_GWB1_33_38]KKP57836.1 MAG: putative rRNA maturation factor [Microgenomates group bacterium GW2011_GWD1_33_9]
MIKINVSKQTNYPISTVNLKNFLQKFFLEKGIVSDAEVFVSFVNEAKMKDIGKKYYRRSLASSAGKNDLRIHNVFSFVDSESMKFPGDKINLGEIVVCFPIVVKEANTEGKLIEEKVLELIEHSALHLLGIHHEE